MAAVQEEVEGPWIPFFHGEEEGSVQGLGHWIGTAGHGGHVLFCLGLAARSSQSGGRLSFLFWTVGGRGLTFSGRPLDRTSRQPAAH